MTMDALDESAAAAFVDALGPLTLDFELDAVAVDVDNTFAEPSASEATESASNSQEGSGSSAPSVGKNASRERLKAELAYLREKVESLEHDLNELQQREATSGTQAARPKAAVAKVWKRIATRQLERRQEAEAENDRLKAVLDAQICVAKSLEQMLRKRSSEAILDLYEGARGSKKRCRAEDDFNAVYAHLLEDIECAYSIVDQVFETNGLANVYDETIRGYTVKTRSTKVHEQAYIEFVDVAILPFAFERAMRAVWQSTADEYARDHRIILNSRRGADHFGVRYQIQKRGRASSQDRLDVTIIMRQYIESDRMVIVWRATNASSNSSHLYADETGWNVLKRVPTTGSDDTDEAVVMQSCVHLVPRWSDSDRSRQVDQIQTGDFTKLVVDFFEDDVSSITEAAENLLLDERVVSTN
ncbi:hypothetical protein Poli38472_004990 [Pythium oligandrum]|uniref:M96 mating-specific protein family n=1 Tax=Pythium oligandrum TaxID=41045 RepID=A0A8K1CBI7_PYTOL|nr:hypothetical protein Poli38472_004990 [Pythium oligandrum]|eukprot:TMW59921.1 hypothetical protein Poli38472_004990 [Pythium oligandrum]